MAKSCPECGSPLAYSRRTAAILEGDCPNGHRTIAVIGVQNDATAPGEVSDITVPGDAGPAEGSADVERGPAGVEGPACAACGNTLSLHARSPTRLEAECSSCGAKYAYRLDDGEGPRERRPDRRGPRESSFEGKRPTRPCRQCGGPIRFSTREDGVREGVCESCGNRFTLAPRRTDYRSEGRYGGGRERRYSDRPSRGAGPRRTGRRGDREGPPPWTKRRRRSEDD